MDQTDRRHASTNQRAIRGFAVIAAVIGALSATIIAPSVAAAATTQTTATVISTAKNAKLGTILVSGNTVYTVKVKSACTAQCAKTWTPVELPSGVTSATAGTGVDSSKLGTTTTSDGALQVTYGGKPLYWSTKDKAPGQVHGAVSDKWGKWAAVVTAAAKSGSTGDTSPGTGGNAF
jgi:predicted lipoprotein with Yx(FWY)xxD motif